MDHWTLVISFHVYGSAPVRETSRTVNSITSGTTQALDSDRGLGTRELTRNHVTLLVEVRGTSLLASWPMFCFNFKVVSAHVQMLGLFDRSTKPESSSLAGIRAQNIVLITTIAMHFGAIYLPRRQKQTQTVGPAGV